MKPFPKIHDVFVGKVVLGTVLLIMGVDPIWLGVMIGLLLQTSFLTPPFGFSLFYLRSIAPAGQWKDKVTGRLMDASEAERAGLVSRVVSADRCLDEAIEAATVIAAYSNPSVMMAKESINRAFEGSLSEGMLFERRMFHSLFATEDQKEGMSAFVEKRKPDFKNK